MMRAHSSQLLKAIELAHELKTHRPDFNVAVAKNYEDACAMLPALNKFDIVVIASDLDNILVKM